MTLRLIEIKPEPLSIKEYVQNGGDAKKLSAYLEKISFPLQEFEKEVHHLNLYRIAAKYLPISEERSHLFKLFKERVLRNKSYDPLLYYFSLEHRLYKLAEQFFKFGCAINAQELGNGCTALHLGCGRNDPKMVKWLLNHQANPNIKSGNHGETPFHISCTLGALNILTLLLQKGALLKETSASGQTGLHYAASYGQLQTVSFLRKKGLSLRTLNAQNQSPLHISWMEGHKKVSRYLIDHGAIINQLYRIESTHLHFMEETPLEPLPIVEVEELLTLFDRINFSEPEKPGYRDPKYIKGDVLDPETQSFCLIPPSELREKMVCFIERIKKREAWVGTPKNPVERTEWYLLLENKLKYIIQNCKEQKETNDPTPFAPQVIELALAGFWCGGENMQESQFQIDLTKEAPANLKEQIIDQLRLFKREVVSSLLDQSFKHNVNCQNAILQWIDTEAGIPEKKNQTKSYFHDHFAQEASKTLNRPDYIKAFYASYTPQALLDVIDYQVNKSPLISKFLILDFFKENIPADFHPQVEKREREYAFLGEVSDAKGKIKKSYLLDLLILFGVLKEIT